MINIKQQPEVRIVGASQTPVIVVDNVCEHLDVLRRTAQEYAQFSPASGGYPGVRASLPAPYSRQLVTVLEPLIKSVYGLPASMKGRCCHQLFSLVTTAPENLTVLQRLPHFDTVLPDYFAIMHYLGEGDFGGTGFFCHRSTAIERVTEENKACFIDRVRHEVSQSLPSARYVAGSDDKFTMVDSVEYKTNRLLVYPGNFLHSGLIDAARDISACPLTGRLTANIFIDFTN